MGLESSSGLLDLRAQCCVFLGHGTVHVVGATVRWRWFVSLSGSRRARRGCSPARCTST
jgi:hypothetical protein